MARVAKVSVDLEANSAKFEAGINRATAALNSAGAKWNRQLSVINKGMTGLASVIGAVSAGMIVSFGRQNLDAAGDLGEMAAQAGVATDALQVLQYAAAQNRVSAEQMSDALAYLTANIGKAVDGTKTQIDAFEGLGVKILDVNGRTRSTIDVLGDVADAYVRAGDKELTAAHIRDIFGRSGMKLIPILEQGRAGLEKYAEAAHISGSVLDEELIAAADGAADKIAAMEMAASKAAQTFMAKLAPAITAVLSAVSGDQTLDGLKDKLTKLYDERAYQASKPLTGESFLRLEILDREIDDAEKLILKIRQMRAEANAPATGGVSNPTAEGGGKSEEDKAADKAAKVVEALQFQQEQLGRTAREQFVFNELQKAGAQLGTDLGDTIAYEAGKAYDATEGLRAVNDAERAYLDTLYEKDAAKDRIGQTASNEIADNDRLIAALRISEEEYEKVKAQLEIINQYRQAGIEMSPEEVAAAEKLASTLGRQRDQMKDLEDRYDTAKRLGADMGMTFQSAFEDAIIAGERFSDVLKSLAQDLARLVLRETVTAPLAKGISSSIGDVLGGLFGGGKASGGPVDPSHWYMVGEHGPEPFVPDTAGTIIPHDQIGSAAGSGPTVYIDATGADAAALARVQRQVEQMNGSFEKRSVAAMVAAKGRNPKILG